MTSYVDTRKRVRLFAGGWAGGRVELQWSKGDRSPIRRNGTNTDVDDDVDDDGVVIANDSNDIADDDDDDAANAADDACDSDDADDAGRDS